MIFYQNLKQELIDKLDKGIFYAEEWMVVIRVLEHEGYIAMATNLLDRLKHYKGNKRETTKAPLMDLKEELLKEHIVYPNAEIRIEASEEFIKDMKIYMIKKYPNTARMMKDEGVRMELFGFPLVQVDDVDRYRIVVIPDDLKGGEL